MAGRKSNTATAQKPKAIRPSSTKLRIRAGTKGGAVSKRAVEAVDRLGVRHMRPVRPQIIKPNSVPGATNWGDKANNRTGINDLLARF